VLAISPIVFNALIVGGIVVSALWARYITLHLREIMPASLRTVKIVATKPR
jgi:hypothetical protein